MGSGAWERRRAALEEVNNLKGTCTKQAKRRRAPPATLILILMRQSINISCSIISSQYRHVIYRWKALELNLNTVKEGVRP